jgi:ParB family chromosome partitioning protein
VNQGEVIEIPLNKIKLGDNSRLSMSDTSIVELMQSIKEHGMLQAPVVMKGEKGGYELIAGRRRFLAASKLGWSKLQCSVIEPKDSKDIKLKNLTENIQRSNISLVEVGRYIEMLKKEDEMTPAEIAVRLGTTKNYVETAMKAYNEVPKEFQKFLIMSKTNERPKPGQIPISTAKAIINAKKTFRLTQPQMSKLFKAAKSDKDFQTQSVGKYAQAIKSGKTNFTAAVRPMKTIAATFDVSEDHFDDLTYKYITKGPFKSMKELVEAVLTGKKSIKFDIKARR